MVWTINGDLGGIVPKKGPLTGKNNKPYKYKKAPSVSFKGIGSLANSTFSLIQTHEVAGPTIVNVTAMVVPRSAVDYTRNKEAGLETARRETTSLVSSSLLPGFYALGAGALLGLIKNPLGVTSRLMTGEDTIDILKDSWERATQSASGGADKAVTRMFIDDTLDGAEALKGDRWVPLTKKAKEHVSEELSKLIHDGPDAGKTAKQVRREIAKEGIKLSGTEKFIRIKGAGKSVETSMKTLVSNLYELPKELFIPYTKKGVLEQATQKIKFLNRQKGVAGFGLATVIAVSTQFINRYLTEKKTGSHAFVGLPNYEKMAMLKKKKEIKEEEKKLGWKFAAAKAASVGAMMGMLGATYAESLNPKKILNSFKPSNLANKLRFTGKFVTLNQLRALSAITISGRILASVDFNELRETNVRDYLGFLNWLVFGGFVAKLAGKAFGGDDVLNYKKPFEKTGNKFRDGLRRVGHIIKNSELKTNGEIDAIKGLSDEAKSRLKNCKNWGGIAMGLLYSIAFLGLAIPLINKYMTNHNAEDNDPDFGKTLEEPLLKSDPELFNKNLLLVEETLGSLNPDQAVNPNHSATSVSSHFFIPAQSEQGVYNKFLLAEQKYLNK